MNASVSRSGFGHADLEALVVNPNRRVVLRLADEVGVEVFDLEVVVLSLLLADLDSGKTCSFARADLAH